jgi:DNA-binding CsgD family transcriptional regulator/tetratricopeptide (TPR) repeat protein
MLMAASTAPAALIVSGEPGIGRTTLWSAGVREARERGFQVLSARPVARESILVYASLADLLSGVASRALPGLPEPQRNAVERILLLDNQNMPDVDRRTVAMAFLSVVRQLSEAAPVLLAIDDLQWLDPASADAISFVTRRLSRRVGVLATVQTQPERADPASWLQLYNVAHVQRIRLAPLSVGALHSVLSTHLGRSLPRPVLIRIHEISGGNPFYALELARTLSSAAPSANPTLPGTLVDVVQSRVGCLPAEVQDALLAAACVAAPIIELVANATNTERGRLVGLLEEAEDAGVVRLEGQRIHFAHPLLARGVYSSATSSRRRRMHRRLAELVVEPELQARHLALAATGGDPQLLRRLDAAAQSARRRGSPAEAAELLELAIGLDGNRYEHRIRCARAHFAAGDVNRARTLLEQAVAGAEPGPLRAEALSVLARVRLFDDSVGAATDLLERALNEVGDQPQHRIPMLVVLAVVQLHSGAVDAAVATADAAVRSAGRLDDPALRAQAGTVRQLVGLVRGEGLDAAAIGMPGNCPVTSFWARVHNALMAAWVGQLDDAGVEIAFLRRSSIERGNENDRMYLDFHSAMIEVWRGDFSTAAATARDTAERAEQCGGDIPMAMLATLRASLAAYAGRVDEARSNAEAAIAVSRRCGAHALGMLARGASAFLDVSLGDYRMALETLAPLLIEPTMGTELITASYVPDAVEALVGVGRIAEAEQLTVRLEADGSRLDRPWMLAIGGRCRAMLYAATGDLDAAVAAAELALTHHERLPMPFERARTQLLYGQLQRRARRQAAAAATLSEALAAFTGLDTPLWVERARDELARTNTRPRSGSVLTPSEQRVAELVATGMTNREVASSLFVSPKTVEANIERIYRKLDIHSRAELGTRIGQLDGQG